MKAGRLITFLVVVAMAALVAFGCEEYTPAAYTPPTPTVDNKPPGDDTQVTTLERYATQSAAEMNAIQAHQATATALAVNYQATVTADQAILEQQRLAIAAQKAAAQAQAADAVAATATERAYQATATSQAREWEATAVAQKVTATAQAREWEATAVAQKTTATAQAIAFNVAATRIAWEVQASVTAESVQATRAVYQAETARQAQQQESILAYGRIYGIPIVLLALLGCIVALIAYALRQYARRPTVYRPEDLLSDAATRPKMRMGHTDSGETPAQLTRLPPEPPSPGLRSVRILRRLDQAKWSGILSGALRSSLEAAWKRRVRKDNDSKNTD
ncbi:MAG: hypothetical protein JXA21_01825 [Anaerolineae bacterium]|nr:hypothetical protein [Anaerolineae bacterium]